jgi:hypothetical protein
MGTKNKRETIKIIGYDDGIFELFVNGQRRNRVKSIEFKVSVEEVPTLTTTEFPI